MAKASVKSFLNKRVDVVITDEKDPGTKPKRSKVKCQNRSAVMLGMATNAGPSCCGTSSVFKIATAWKMKILKYADLLSCMKDNPYLQVCQIKKQERGNTRALCSPFVKVEDHSRQYKPEFVEMKSFPYMDLDTEGTQSPFETWFRENCGP